MIELKFKVIDLNSQIEIIQDFLSLKDDTAKFIAESFELNFEDLFYSDGKLNRELVKSCVVKRYEKRLKDLNLKCEEFKKIWNKQSKFVNNEIIQIFGKEFYFQCVAYINLNPVWPRFLETKEFHVFLDSKEDELITFSVHEILHFVWFEIWKENFPLISDSEYESPNLSWLISEIAIEPMFRFSNLKNLSKAKPAYDWFYFRKIGEKTIIEIANEIFENSKNINDFQENMFEFFSKVEKITQIQ